MNSTRSQDQAISAGVLTRSASLILVKDHWIISDSHDVEDRYE